MEIIYSKGSRKGSRSPERKIVLREPSQVPGTKHVTLVEVNELSANIL